MATGAGPINSREEGWASARLRRRMLLALPLFGALLIPLGAPTADTPPHTPLRVVIVGGGPSPEYNQVAIESNVRYVGRLLPEDTIRTTLFADGNPAKETVLYEEESKPLSAGEQVVGLLLEGHGGGSTSVLRYRKPNVGCPLDGACKRPDVSRVFDQLGREVSAQATPTPLLLYFTGHGSPDQGDRENNGYDLWGRDDKLSVKDLSSQIAKLPDSTPVTVVMVQCFSGAFGNLLFENGNPKGDVIRREFAGFFATVKERVAAGCTPALNEAEYKDFTSYFFAALSGRDRVGRAIGGADYNGDGRVGMDEAFCYTLSHDESIDVPVASTDVFLRRFVAMEDTVTFHTSFARVQRWASHAQRAALDALSTHLNLSGDDRLWDAYTQEFYGGDQPTARGVQEATREFSLAREEGERVLFERWPALKSRSDRDFQSARREAAADLGREAGEGRWDTLLHAESEIDRSEEARYRKELQEARMLRFVRLAKSVVLGHALRETGDAATKQRYLKLVDAESRTLLPPADSIHRASNRPRLEVGASDAPTLPCPCQGDGTPLRASP